MLKDSLLAPLLSSTPISFLGNNMKVAMSCAVVVTIIIATLVPEVCSTEHTVGGSAGWTQSVDYNTWASGETFVVGDTLQFSYGLSHSVDQVNKSNYESCSTGKPIQSYSGGSTTVNLTSAGPMYFFCPTVGHCAGGMKLEITVQSLSTAPSTAPSSPTTTPSITPSTAPSSPTTTPSITPSTAPSSPTTTPSITPSTPSTTPNTNSSPPPPTTPNNGVGTASSSNTALAVVSFVVSTLVLGGINELFVDFKY